MPMPKTVKEAAERLRIGWPKGYESLPFETCTGTPREWQIQYGIDTELLAQEYLDEHPADEDEQITPEWLVSVGGKKSEYTNDVTCWKEQKSGRRSVDLILNFGGGSLVSIGIVDDGPSQRWFFIPCKTRGDFYRLASALGIPLTPEASK